VLAGAGPSAQIGFGTSGLRADRPGTSLKDLRDQDLVRKRFDFSCGAAALATMLRHGFGEDVTEQQILIDLFSRLSDDEQRRAEREGFSLLDLQGVARARGYAAEGFRLEPADLASLGGPVIVFIEPRGYRHFAVLKGIRGDRAYLADPSRGNVRMPMYTFLESWVQDDGRGIVFAVEPEAGRPGDRVATGLTQALGDAGRPYPEMLAARELLAVGGLLRPRLPR
jgi:predicted double-glycine peptidase